MFAHMNYAASALTTASPGAFASESSSLPSSQPQLMRSERPSGLSALPLEVFGNICERLGSHDLAQFAQTCTFANNTAERQLWRHLNLVRGESDLPATWRASGPEPRVYKTISQSAFKQLIGHLRKRPDLAHSVHTITFAASSTLSKQLAEVIRLVGDSLREIDMRVTTESSYVGNDNNPCLVSPDVFFKSLGSLSLVTKMNLSLEHHWANTFRCALAATPNLAELRMGPILGNAGGWGRDPSIPIEIRQPIFSAVKATAPAPILPHLRFLRIDQMATELEVAIMDLLKTSSVPTVTLWLEDYEGHYPVKSVAFNKFLTEWQESGRLKLEVSLPGEESDEVDLREEEEESDLFHYVQVWDHYSEPWGNMISVKVYRQEEVEEGPVADFLNNAASVLEFMSWDVEKEDMRQGIMAPVDADGWPIDVDFWTDDFPEFK